MIEFFVVSIICILIASPINKNKYALELSFVILTIFLAIRYNFGSDYPEYLRHFDLANQGNLKEAFEDERLEDGWVLLSRICKPIGFFGMVIITTVFEQFVLYRFIKKYVPKNWYWLALFCYLFSSTLCLTGLSMMRQFLAMCVCLLAFDLAVRKKIIISLILVVLAGQFHTSAFVCLPICFIGLLKDFRMTKAASFWVLGLLMGFSFVAASLFGKTLVDIISNSVFIVYENRFEDEYVARVGVTTFVEYFLFASILLMQAKQDKANRFFVLIFIMFQVINAFRPVAPLINRVGLYFYILFPVCMTNSIIKIRNPWKVCVIVLLVLVRFYGYYSFITSSGWGNSFLEYQTIFSTNQWM